MHNQPQEETQLNPLQRQSNTALVHKKDRHSWLIGGFVVILLILCSSVTAAGYFLWYQNPDKVVSDALVEAITASKISASGVMNLETKDGLKVKIAAVAHTQNQGGAYTALKLSVKSSELDATVGGEGIFSNEGDLYIKVHDFQKTIDLLKAQPSVDSETIDTMFGAVIKKIDNTWIKISKEDLGDVDESYAKTQKCIADISKSFETDRTFRRNVMNETQKTYRSHSFIIIGNELTPRTIRGLDSIGYPVSIDRAKADAFFGEFANTQLGKKITECDGTINFSDFARSDVTNDSNDEPKIELWVSRFGHSITEINLKQANQEESGSIVMNPTFNQNDKVSIPPSSIPFKEILSDLEAGYNDLYGTDTAEESAQIMEGQLN